MLSYVVGLALLAMPAVAGGEPPSMPLIATQMPATEALVLKMDIDEVIALFASKHGLSDEDAELMKKVVFCESSNNPKAFNPHDPNSGSKGIAQFQDATFAHYAKEVGLVDPDVWNPFHSLDVMAYMFSKNEHGQWSCYKMVT